MGGMTVGLELVCCAGAGTADVNTTKNKGRTLTSLLFIRTSCFEELPNSPRLLRTMPPSYCPLGRGLYCPVGEAEDSIYARVRLIGSRGGPKKVASDTNISKSHSACRSDEMTLQCPASNWPWSLRSPFPSIERRRFHRQ